MKNYFCLKLKRDPNYYYKTEDTDPHQRELKLQSSLVINQQYFNKIKITDASLDQHEDLLRKGKEGAIFTEIINNRRQLEEDKSSFVNYIGRGGFWYSGSETSDAPDDGYSTITPLALKRYLADNGEENKSLIENTRAIKAQIFDILENYRQAEPLIENDRLTWHLKKGDFYYLKGWRDSLPNKLPKIFTTAIKIIDFLHETKRRKQTVSGAVESTPIITLRKGQEFTQDFNIIGKEKDDGVDSDFLVIDKKLVEIKTKNYLIEPVFISYYDEENRKENCLVEKIIVKTEKKIKLSGKLTLKGTCYKIKKIAEEEIAGNNVSLFTSYELVSVLRAKLFIPKKIFSSEYKTTGEDELLLISTTPVSRPKIFMKLDRVLPGAMHYPEEYGSFENALGQDGDLLDGVCINEFPTFPGCRLPVRIIGVLRMIDEGEEDNKILVVNAVDPRFQNINDLKNVSSGKLDEIANFFLRYKELEKKEVKIVGWGSKKEAKEIFARGQYLYHKYSEWLKKGPEYKKKLVEMLRKEEVNFFPTQDF
ncbi:15360_t:CDS:2 [Gigaspora margarita]|uniref:inorganic diphosphatase n=1 Tax=Gigaspora margarita TaxID=4874 RepID=A0ABN7UPP7_GIGMA|nr:15360_t:CDS:2 [Gigaspora margarita]